MTTKRTPALLLAGALILLTTACTGPSTDAAAETTSGATRPQASGPTLSPVMLIGDSVAKGESVPLATAFAAGGIKFHSLASDGGGTVIGPVSEELWKTLPERIATDRPRTVIYQITTYDWGTPQEQKTAYQRLLTTVTDAGAKLVFVTMPPIKPDDFYRPHMADLNRAAQVARTIADASAGKAVVLDASQVWGKTYQRIKDGKTDRSSDGVHTCPQGAARFTHWLLDEMTELYPTFTAPAPEKWANTGWSADKAFVGC